MYGGGCTYTLSLCKIRKVKNPFKRHNKPNEYKDLYKTILEIGKSRINEGVSYHELIEILKTKGFTIESCSQLAIKKFFCDNFFHLSNHRKPEPTPQNIERYHKYCGFVMTGEACLTLERLIELGQLKRANRINFIIGIAAIAIGFVGAFLGNYPDWDEYCAKKHKNKSEQSSPHQESYKSKEKHLKIYEQTKPLLDSLQYNRHKDRTIQTYKHR